MSNLKDLNKRLYYFSMFDGHLEKVNGNARLRVSMLEEHLDYLDVLSTALDELSIGHSMYLPKIIGKSRNQLICLQTKQHPILTKIHSRLYASGKKAIEPHMLTMLDAEALAIAFMADGSRRVDARSASARPEYRLHTNSWTYGDCWMFKKLLKDIFDLEFNTDKTGKEGQFNLRLRLKDSEVFERIVAPFVLPSFQYKLGRQAPEMGDDIVCSAGRLAEIGRNDQSTSIDVVTIKVPNSH